MILKGKLGMQIISIWVFYFMKVCVDKFCDRLPSNRSIFVYIDTDYNFIESLHRLSASSY